MEKQDEEVVREFLIESHENLSLLDRDLVELEKHPGNAELVSSIFRTIHTIKGTCGFLAFTKLEKLTHQTENLLSQLRAGHGELNPGLASLILETVDVIRSILACIEANGEEGPDTCENLMDRLRAAAQLMMVQDGQAATVQTGSSGGTLPPAATGESDERAAAEAPDGNNGSEEDIARSSAVADANIRVGVGLLDKLMDLVGELVLTRNQILQFNAEREDASLNTTSQRLNLITTELQEGVMKTRMQPIGTVWSKLPRVVRDLSVSLGKQLRLEMDGAETELDRTIIEAIKDPLVHLVRNSCDHGIEMPEVRARAGKPAQGRLTLRAYHEGGQVNIEIGDDGAGIDVARVKQKAIEKGFVRPEQAEKMTDREALNLIFYPGFSTAQTVTSVSGRGVGMDVVKSHIEKAGGIVDLFSRPGEGTTVRIKIPLTLAIIPGLVITGGTGPAAAPGVRNAERFVIPQVSLVELIRLEDREQIELVHGTPVFRRRGSLLPIAYLNEVLGLECRQQSHVLNIVVLQAEDRQFGLVVDAINDTQEIVVKPLGQQLKGLTVYAGATIMGDGRVALILDVLGIGQRSKVLVEARERARASKDEKVDQGVEKQRLLLFRAASFERLAIPLSLVARLEEFPRESIECAGGGQVVQYRDGILSLVHLRAVLEPGAPPPEPLPDPLQVVVFSDGDRSVGVVVDQILDVAEEAVTVRQRSGRKGLLGSAVVGGKVTDFVDLNYVLQAAEGHWSHGAGQLANRKRVLVAEASAFSRGLISSGLDMAGYQVVEAMNLDEAIRRLEQHPVDLIVAAMDLPPKGISELLLAMRRRPQWESVPVLAVTDSAEQARTFPGLEWAFQDCQEKFDREAMLESLARLSSAVNSAHHATVCAGKES